MPHPHTETALASASASGLPADSVVKAVVLKGADGFMLALLPASRHIQFDKLRQLLGDDVDIAGEEQVETLSAIEFDAIDRQPVDLVFLLLLPTAPAAEQLNALALVARRLRDADTTRNARRPTDPPGLYAARAQSSK